MVPLAIGAGWVAKKLTVKGGKKIIAKVSLKVAKKVAKKLGKKGFKGAARGAKKAVIKAKKALSKRKSKAVKPSRTIRGKKRAIAAQMAMGSANGSQNAQNSPNSNVASTARLGSANGSNSSNSSNSSNRNAKLAAEAEKLRKGKNKGTCTINGEMATKIGALLINVDTVSKVQYKTSTDERQAELAKVKFQADTIKLLEDILEKTCSQSGDVFVVQPEAPEAAPAPAPVADNFVDNGLIKIPEVVKDNFAGGMLLGLIGMVGTIIKLGEVIWDVASNMATWLGEAVIEMYNEAMAYMAETFNDGMQYVADAGQEMSLTLNNWFNNVSDWFSETWKDLKNKADELLTDILVSVTKFLNKGLGPLEDTINSWMSKYGTISILGKDIDMPWKGSKVSFRIGGDTIQNFKDASVERIANRDTLAYKQKVEEYGRNGAYGKSEDERMTQTRDNNRAVKAKIGKEAYYIYNLKPGDKDYADAQEKRFQAGYRETSVIGKPQNVNTWMDDKNITSNFGVARDFIDGTTGKMKHQNGHSGIDYRAPEGTPIYAIGNGFVEKWEHGKSGGDQIIVQDPVLKRRVVYAHLKWRNPLIPPGTEVVAGVTLIGLSGGKKGAAYSGSSTGPHIHIQVKAGKSINVDPKKYMAKVESIIKTGKVDIDPTGFSESIDARTGAKVTEAQVIKEAKRNTPVIATKVNKTTNISNVVNKKDNNNSNTIVINRGSDVGTKSAVATLANEKTEEANLMSSFVDAALFVAF